MKVVVRGKPEDGVAKTEAGSAKVLHRAIVWNDLIESFLPTSLQEYPRSSTHTPDSRKQLHHVGAVTRPADRELRLAEQAIRFQ
jgi:hypothetical protein